MSMVPAGQVVRTAVRTILAVADKQAEANATLDLTDVSERKVEVDYLRAFVITRVLFVHAALADATAAFINSENPIASANPIVNDQRRAMVSGMTGFFLRFAKRHVRIFDSLSENSYGIYIVHYVL